MNVYLNTTPLKNANAIRGVGVYTRFLQVALKKFDHSDIHFSSTLPKSDIVHYPYFDLFQSTLPLSLSFLRSKPKLVVTVHDVIPLLYPDYYPVGIKGHLHFLRQKLALHQVDAVLTDSMASKNDIVKLLGIKQDKIHVIYLAGNPELTRVSATMIKDAREKHELPDEYLLYVGDINYNKNIPALIESMRDVPPNIHLVCVGNNFHPQPIPEWTKIEKALLGIEQRVHFRTNIPKDDTKTLSALYSGAVAYVQPSLYEGFGLPLLEAMQCETPVVSTQNSSLVEVGGQHVVYSDTSSSSLANAINQVLSWSAQERKKRASEALGWSRQFSWEKTALETIKVYDTLC